MRALGRIITPVWIGLNIVLVILYLAGYMAYFGYVWRFWWIEMIAVGMLYLAGASFLALLLNIVGRRWRLVAVHGLLLILTLVRFNPASRVAHNLEPSDDDLVVMTYNVPQWWGFYMGPKALEMAAFFEHENPDVALLQEASIGFFNEEPTVRAAPYVAILLDSLGYRAAEMRTESRIFTHQPIIGRVDFMEKQQSLLEHPDDYVGGTHVVRTQFNWQGRDVVLYNVHMRTYGRDKPWEDEAPEYLSPAFWMRYISQYRQAYRVRNWEVEQILRKVEAEVHPVIISGDLNSTPHNWVYRRLVDGRQDAFAVAGRGWGMTYHNRLPLVRIDFILVDQEFEVVEAHVPSAWLSDHRPVVARLRWRNDGSLSGTDP